MNLDARLPIILIIAALTLLGAGYHTPAQAPTTKSFSISNSYGARTTFSFKIRESGCIWVKATWTGTAKKLALILNGPNQTLPYNRQDGSSGLTLTYNVKATDIKKATKEQPWTLTITNFGGGTARGRITIDIPPNQVTCTGR
jgi:hypothetical protein